MQALPPLMLHGGSKVITCNNYVHRGRAWGRGYTVPSIMTYIVHVYYSTTSSHRYPTALRNILKEVAGLRDLCKSKVDGNDKVHVHVYT